MNIIKKSKERRSLYEIIFGSKQQSVQTEQNQQLSVVKFLNNYNGGTYSSNSYSGDIYNDPCVRPIIDTIARYMSKARIIHTLKGVEQNSQLNRLLQRPNPTQNSYDFIYKIVTNLYLSNNTYVYIQFSPTGQPMALWPIEYNNATLKQDKNNNLYLSFTFNNGQHKDEPFENMIVLRRNFKGDFYGETNAPIMPVLGVMQSIREGIIKAVANSAVVRGILCLVGALQPEDREAKKNEFENNYLNAASGGGVVVQDGTMEYKPIEQSTTTVIDEKVTAEVRKQLCDYFGISPAIVSGDYTETQFQAFWESTIEPLLVQFELEFTQKIFNSNQRAFGNEIKFQSNKIEYLSYKTRIDLINSVKELGVINKSMLAQILNLPEVEDGDTVLQSLNYIDSKIANQYQVGDNNTTGEQQENTED